MELKEIVNSSAPSIFFVVSFFLTLFFLQKRKKEVNLSNELARLNNEKKFEEAIKQAEELPVTEKSFALLRLNLMAAYYNVGRIDEAKKLLNSLKDKDFGSSKWILDDWRKKLSSQNPWNT